MSERLPELLDAKSLQAELGVTRAAAEAIMRRLPIVAVRGSAEGLRSAHRRRRPDRRADVHEGQGSGVGWARLSKWAGTALTAPPRHRRFSSHAQQAY